MSRSINRWFLLATMALATPALARDRQPAHPAESPASWFRDDDYPADAKRARQEGRVAVRISIDAAGRVNACEVTASSGSAVLDAKTCELVATRGKFAPALDERGKPVASTYSLSTRWSLANGPPFPKASWRTAQILSIDPAGKVVNCVDSAMPAGAASPACGRFSAMSAPAAIQLRGGTGAVGPVLVTFEYSFRADGDVTPQPMAYEVPGAAIVSLQIIHFDVDTSGAVRNCRIVRRQGAAGGDLCSAQAIRYASQSMAAGAMVTIAISRSEAR